jgi:hypothetical protein
MQRVEFTLDSTKEGQTQQILLILKNHCGVSCNDSAHLYANRSQEDRFWANFPKCSGPSLHIIGFSESISISKCSSEVWTGVAIKQNVRVMQGVKGHSI